MTTSGISSGQSRFGFPASSLDDLQHMAISVHSIRVSIWVVREKNTEKITADTANKLQLHNTNLDLEGGLPTYHFNFKTRQLHKIVKFRMQKFPQ